MYAVRIDKGEQPGEYVFKVSPCPGAIEIVALDSTPGIMAIVNASDPSHACSCAWNLAARMHYAKAEQISAESLLQVFLLEAAK